MVENEELRTRKLEHKRKLWVCSVFQARLDKTTNIDEQIQLLERMNLCIFDPEAAIPPYDDEDRVIGS